MELVTSIDGATFEAASEQMQAMGFAADAIVRALEIIGEVDVQAAVSLLCSEAEDELQTSGPHASVTAEHRPNPRKRSFSPARVGEEERLHAAGGAAEEEWRCYPSCNAYPRHGADWLDTHQKPTDCASLDEAKRLGAADPQTEAFTWEQFENGSGRFWKLVRPNPAEFSKKFGNKYDVHVKLREHGQSHVKLREHGQSHARCIEEARQNGVHFFEPHEAREAALHLHQDGFVVLHNVLGNPSIATLKAYFAEVTRTAKRQIPRGNRGQHRWEVSGILDKGRVLPLVVDRPAVLDTLSAYWGHRDIAVTTLNGIVSEPGAKNQGFHIDNPGDWGKHLQGESAKHLKVYFTLVDHDSLTGSTHFLRGSHKYTARLDKSGKKLPGHVDASCPRGCAVIMDMRTWHYGMANRSSIDRPMLGVHFSDGKHHPVWSNWGPHRFLDLTRYRNLSPTAQHVCRQVVKR